MSVTRQPQPISLSASRKVRYGSRAALPSLAEPRLPGVESEHGPESTSGALARHQSRMPTAHLLFGYLGSGKTTLAKALERQHGAVRFTPDEWMARLFGEDPPAEVFQEKAAAILSIMEPIWTRCLSVGVDVILDYGFWRRSDRDRTRQLVREVGAEPLLWRLDCSDQEARERVALRNRADHRSLYIAPATFDLLKRRVEPIEPDEDHTPYRAS